MNKVVYNLPTIRRTEEEIQQEIATKQAQGISDIKRICFVGRVSTDHSEQDTSLETQKQMLLNFLRYNNNYVVVCEVYERDTGTLLSKRPKFQQVLQEAYSGAFDMLIFKDTKRMCRNTKEFLELIDTLREHNVNCYFMAEQIDSFTGDRFMLSLYSAVAEQHSNNLHQTLTASFKIMAQREEGRVPNRCFGYRKPPRTSIELDIYPQEAIIVKEVYERYAEHEAPTSVMRDLNNRGIRTLRNNEFSLHALAKMVRNPIYKGQLVMNQTSKFDVRSKLEKNDPSEYIIRQREDLRIVSDELWQKANDFITSTHQSHLKYSEKNALIENRTEKRIYSTLLRGLIKCPECGLSFKKIQYKASGAKLGYVYKCRGHVETNRSDEHVLCDNPATVNLDAFMICLTEYMENILLKLPDLEKVVKEVYSKQLKELQKTSQDQSLQYEIDEAERKYSVELGLIREGFVDNTDRLQKLKSKLDMLKSKDRIKQLDFPDADEYAKEYIHKLGYNIEQALTSSCLDGLRFNKLFSSIYANSDGTLDITFKNFIGKSNTFMYLGQSLHSWDRRT